MLVYTVYTVFLTHSLSLVSVNCDYSDYSHSVIISRHLCLRLSDSLQCLSLTILGFSLNLASLSRDLWLPLFASCVRMRASRSHSRAVSRDSRLRSLSKCHSVQLSCHSSIELTLSIDYQCEKLNFLH